MEFSDFYFESSGVLSLYELLNFLYFAAAVMFGQRLWHTVKKGGPMHLVSFSAFVFSNYVRLI